MEIEFADRRVPFTSQPELPVIYKGRQLRKTCRLDFLCYDQIIVEIKAVSSLADEHRAQVLNYLSAAEKPLGLLVNFGTHPKVQYERFLPRSR